MKQILTVFKKELKDNIRDRRSVFFALLYGPVLLPLMMVGPLAMGVKKGAIDFDEVHAVHMVAPEQAPNLLRFLLEKNISVSAAESDFKDKVKSQQMDLVIELAPNYATAILEGNTASIRLYYNKKKTDSEKKYHKVADAIRHYNHSLSLNRLDLRGLNSAFVRPIHVLEEDLGEVDTGTKAVSMIVPFIIVLSLTMGGFYLAVDSTAGERERNSLEPLLSLSMPRLSLILGKLFTLGTFVTLSALLATITTFLLLAFIPVKELRAIMQVEVLIFLAVFFLCLPLVPLFTTSMMLIATYARNTKEAQTHLGLAMMIPMAPFFIMQFANIHERSQLVWVPVMSQFMLIEQVVTGEHITYSELFGSVSGTLAVSTLFFWMIVKLYRKESIL